jgi:hypothetical protein
MTSEPEENVTDASPSQTEPAEPDSAPDPDSGDGSGDAARDGSPKPPRWSERQPAPAPWFVGRPGAASPQQADWGLPMPPQPPAPPASPADSPDGGRGAGENEGDASVGGEGRGEAGHRGTGEPAGPSDAPVDQPPETSGEPGTPPVAPPRPPQSPYGPPPPPMPPWRDPGGAGLPQHRQPPRQDDPWQRQQRPPRQPEQQEPRPPLDLRTRWARGLALGAIACTIASIWYSISDFPTWMIGAGAGLALGLVGLWLGVFAQRAALAKGKRAPEAVGAIVWSSIASLLSLMILAFSLIFYTQLSQLSHCLRSATTISAQNQCETNFQNDFGTRG